MTQHNREVEEQIKTLVDRYTPVGSARVHLRIKFLDIVSQAEARGAAKLAEESARSAWSAESAARSAESAWSAESAAESAARSAKSAAWSAESAAWQTERDNLLEALKGIKQPE